MSSPIPEKNPYIPEASIEASAIAVSNNSHCPSGISPEGLTERVAFPLNALKAPAPPIHPTRVAILHPLQKQRNPRASSPYPFERGVVKIQGPVKKRGFTPIFQRYTCVPHVPTSKGPVRGVLVGIVPFDPARVETAASTILLQPPILPLPPLQSGEFQARFSKEESLMKDLARERDQPLLALGTVREIERWIDHKMQYYDLPPEKRDAISERVHEYIIEYQESHSGYMRRASSSGSRTFPY